MTPRVPALLALSLAACSPEPARDLELDAAEQRVLERGEGVEDFAALCRERGATERALAVYDRLGEQGDATARRRLGLQLAQPLVAARRYDDYLDGQSWGPAELDQALWSFMHIERDLDDAQPRRRAAFEADARARLLAAGGRAFEAHAALGQDDQARSAADDVLRFVAPDEALPLLGEHARRAGRPDLADALDER